MSAAGSYGTGLSAPVHLRDEDDGIARQLRRVYLGAFGLIALLVAWATVAVVSGAVIAAGQMVVGSEVKTVQHPGGGIVSEILVANGDEVRAGDVLLRLDGTLARASAGVLRGQILELEIREARLLAERSDAAGFGLPERLADRPSDPLAAMSLREEQALLQARRSSRDGRKAQIAEQIRQLEIEVENLEAQQASVDEKRALVARELDGVRSLYDQQLVSFGRLSVLEQQSVELDRSRGELAAGAAQARGRIAELRLAALQLDADMRSEVSNELREVQMKLAELRERLTAANDEIIRLEIRAPTDGIVTALAVHTLGAVIEPGQPLLRVVPGAEDLIAEIEVQPQDIDQVALDQPAMIRFHAFDRQTTPELEGRVVYVSAEPTVHPQTGEAHYTARVELDPGEADRLGGRRLIPGIPVEVQLRTGDRTVMSYLVKPIMDQLDRSFRER